MKTVLIRIPSDYSALFPILEMTAFALNRNLIRSALSSNRHAQQFRVNDREAL